MASTGNLRGGVRRLKHGEKTVTWEGGGGKITALNSVCQS